MRSPAYCNTKAIGSKFYIHVHFLFGTISISVRTDFQFMFGSSITVCSDRFPFVWSDFRSSVRIGFRLFGSISICSDQFGSISIFVRIDSICVWIDLGRLRKMYVNTFSVPSTPLTEPLVLVVDSNGQTTWLNSDLFVCLTNHLSKIRCRAISQVATIDPPTPTPTLQHSNTLTTTMAMAKSKAVAFQ